jgi:hypothetical protein
MPSSSRRAGQYSGSKFSASGNGGQYSSSAVDGLPRRRVQRPAIVTYLRDTTDSRLPQRLAEQSTFPPSEAHRGGSGHGLPGSSTGTSMLVAGSKHTSSHDLAALTTSPSLTTSESVPSSVGIRQLEIANSRLLAEGEGGVLVVDPVRTEGNLECPFNLLFCLETFSKMEDWVKHSMTHFREIGPPDFNQCCFCDAKFDSSTAIFSWAKRMEHVAYHHQYGCRLAAARPDFELYTYLWNKRLITDDEYRDLKGNNEDRARAARAYPSPPESPEEPKAYTDTYSNSRSRRERQR